MANKKTSFIKKIKVLWDLCQGYKFKLFILFLLSLISSLFTSVGLSTLSPILDILLKNQTPDTSTFLGKMTQVILNSIPENTLQILMAVFIGMVVIMGTGVLLTNWLKFRLIYQIINKWRTSIFHKYMTSRFAFFNSQEQGKMYHNTLEEPLASSNTLKYLVELGIGAVSAVCYLTFLFLISWKLTLIMIAAGALLMALPLKLVSRRVKKYGRQRITAAQKLSQICNQALSGFRQILLFNQVKEEVDSFNSASSEVSTIFTKSRVIMSIPRALRDFIIFLFLGIAVGFISLFDIEISTLIPILATYGMIGMKLMPVVSEVFSNIVSVSQSTPSVKLISELLLDSSQQRRNDDQGEAFRKLDDDIVLKDLCFGYTDSRFLFDNLNLTIPRGKMTALIGPSGVGKTTLVDLLAGLYPDYRGSIILNGKDIRSYSTRSLSAKMAYVSQDPFIFNRTIAENIALNEECVDKKRLTRALDVSGCKDFISQMDKGVNTIIGERGVMLSGGQRQRISIARAVYKNPELYIFDEATSALDNETEKYIQSSIDEISRTSTVIVIAHRLTTIENADAVYDLGKIVREE